MNKDLDIDVIPEAVDDVVHLGAPVVALGIELFVLLRSAQAMNQQTGIAQLTSHNREANIWGRIKSKAE